MAPGTRSRNRGAAELVTKSALTLLVCCLVVLFSTACCSAAPSQAGRAEVKKTGEYKDVKADFLCRACVALSEVFLDEVLLPTAQRYETYRDPTTGLLRRSSRIGHREREQMIVETHEAIDGLCATLARHVEREAKAALTPGADPLDVQLQSPLATSPDLREGVAVACPMALEEMSDELANLAFKVLLPEVKTTGKEDDRGGAATDGDGTRSYTLPAGGAFCEKVQLCSSYVHYHITSEAEVRRRARGGRRAAAQHAQGDEGAPPQDSAGTEASAKASSERTTAAKEKDEARPENLSTTQSAARKGGKARNATAAARPRRPSRTTEEGETLFQTLQRVVRADTWRELWGTVNHTEVASAAFWVDSLRGMVDRDVLFHMQGYVPLGVVYLLALSGLLLLTVAGVLLCRGTRHTSAPAAPAKSTLHAYASKKAQ